MSNRVKTGNSLQIRKLWKLMAVCGVLTALGLVFVFQQINIHKLAEEIDGMESSLAQIRQKNSVLLLQIEKQKSPEELQHKVAYYGLSLVEIDGDSSIVPVDARAAGEAMVADRWISR